MIVKQTHSCQVIFSPTLKIALNQCYFFLDVALDDKQLSYQYQGYWMVKRVEHVCSFSFFTKLVLIRAGIDTDMPTTLVPAKNFGGRKQT